MANVLPAVFFGHGNPMNAVTHNNYTEAWRRIGAGTPKPKAARLGLAEATALNVPMWTLEQAARVWRFAMSQGHGDQDVTAIARVMESWAGVEVRRKTKQ